MRQVGAFDAGRKRVVRHHRAAQRHGARRGRGEFGDRRPRRRCRAAQRPDRSGIGAGRPPAPRRAATRPASPKIGTSTSAASRSRQAGLPASRSGDAPGREHAWSGLRARTARSRQGGTRPAPGRISVRQRSSRRCRGEDVGIERMMQHQRAAAEEPGQQREADAGKRRGRDGRQHAGVLLEPAFEQHAQSAGQQFEMTARHRHRRRPRRHRR